MLLIWSILTIITIIIYITRDSELLMFPPGVFFRFLACLDRDVCAADLDMKDWCHMNNIL